MAFFGVTWFYASLFHAKTIFGIAFLPQQAFYTRPVFRFELYFFARILLFELYWVPVSTEELASLTGLFF